MDADSLYDLLPAIYRLRDAEQGKPLRALLAILAEQAAVVEENLAQLYDDSFIETCAPWVVPYIGDLIGYRGLYGVAPDIGSPRAEVANTIGYRRRKGTASMLEQLAHDVTGWDARVVEYFQHLATTQYMNHVRPDHAASPDLRHVEILERIGTPFDAVAHTADVRRIARRRGKHNISNVGIFLWRIAEYSLTRSPAFVVDAARFTFNPLGISAPLFNDAVPETDVTGMATERNVPAPIPVRRLARETGSYYGRDLSIIVAIAPRQPDGQIDPSAAPVAIPLEDVIACDLRDDGPGWAHTPPPTGKVAMDPVLGRLAFAEAPEGVVLVSYRYGSVAPMGGGEYERADTFEETLQPVAPVSMPDRIQDALPAGSGAVEIQDSGRYEETLAIALGAGQRLEVRARNGARPALILGGDLAISGAAGSDLTLNGLLIAGGALHVTGELRTLRLVHCTLLPGISIGPDGRRSPLGDAPTAPGSPSLIVESAGTRVEIVDSICGPLEIHLDAEVTVENSIVDALSDDAVAYAGPGGGAGGELTVVNSTLVGRIHARTLPLASDSIFLARVPDAAPEEPRLYPVRIDRRQEGCVRFSYVAPGSRTPRRHKCQPADGARPEEQARVRPQFTSLRYGDPSYGQLSTRCAAEITAGASDGSEMGAFHDLFIPQREANLRVRLDEYLRFGLEAGIFYVS